MSDGVEAVYLELQPDPPTEPGWYWYAAGEHTPCVLEVSISAYHKRKTLMADNGEYSFIVGKKKVNGEYWARIPDPSLKGLRVAPMSW